MFSEVNESELKPAKKLQLKSADWRSPREEIWSKVSVSGERQLTGILQKGDLDCWGPAEALSPFSTELQYKEQHKQKHLTVKPKFPCLTCDPCVTWMAGHQEKPHIPNSFNCKFWFMLCSEYKQFISLTAGWWMKTNSKLLPSLTSLMRSCIWGYNSLDAALSHRQAEAGKDNSQDWQRYLVCHYKLPCVSNSYLS